MWFKLAYLNMQEEKTVSEKPDRELAAAAQRGDGNSFTELCGRYYAAMVAIAHSIIGDRHLAEDAAQQAFATAAIKLPELHDAGKFAGWLRVICRNAASDIGRRQRIIFNADNLSSVPAKQNSSQDTVTVREAISRLTPEAREVIYLRYYDGMTYQRISKVLGISEEAINGRLRRAKEKIYEYLKRNGFDEENI
jgi:RNA polymerase sigma-70 factor (ECF subfamily)